MYFLANRMRTFSVCHFRQLPRCDLRSPRPRRQTHQFNENVYKTIARRPRCLEVCIATDTRHNHQKLPIFPNRYNTPRSCWFRVFSHSPSSGQGTHGLPPADAPIHREADPHQHALLEVSPGARASRVGAHRQSRACANDVFWRAHLRAAARARHVFRPPERGAAHRCRDAVLRQLAAPQGYRGGVEGGPWRWEEEARGLQEGEAVLPP
jgi:hypothetical protein